MSTSSRGISRKLNHSRASHTPGKTKGGFCVKPRNYGIAINGNPYKGAGIKGGALTAYESLWKRYKGAKGNV